jgi:hypothetical protein
MSASVAEQQRRLALGLYRAVLRAHRRVLPPDMRALGDAYARDEFRLHRNASRTHLQQFFEQWLDYLSQLNAGVVGRGLSSDEVGTLSTEQRAQLDKLREETRKLPFE